MDPHVLSGMEYTACTRLQAEAAARSWVDGVGGKVPTNGDGVVSDCDASVRSSQAVWRLTVGEHAFPHPSVLLSCLGFFEGYQVSDTHTTAFSRSVH